MARPIVVVITDLEGPRRGVVLKKKWVDAIRRGWTPDACKVTNVYKTYKMDHFIQRSVWAPSTSVHARLHPCGALHNVWLLHWLVSL